MREMPEITEIFKDNTFPDMSYKQLIELFRTDCDGSKFFALCREHRLYQIWNKSYLDALAKEIKKRVGTELVVEVCAGDGVLSRELSKRGINIIATDNNSWLIITHGRKVFKADAIEAVRRYKPKMVIASWIPYGAEIDIKLLREKIPYVVLIGEPEGGCCGSEEVWAKFEGLLYNLIFLKNVDKFNFCRTDYFLGRTAPEYKHSQTALFDRSGPEYSIPNGLFKVR